MNLWAQAILIALIALPIAYAYDCWRQMRAERFRQVVKWLEELEAWEDDDE